MINVEITNMYAQVKFKCKSLDEVRAQMEHMKPENAAMLQSFLDTNDIKIYENGKQILSKTLRDFLK